MVKRLFLFLILILPLSFYTSCDQCHFGEIPKYFDIQDLSVFLLKDKGFSQFDTITEQQNIERSNLDKFILNFKVNYVSQHEMKQGNGQLMACDPSSPGAFGSKFEYLKDLKIYTMYNYNSSRFSGQIINDYFLIRNNKSEYISIQNYLKDTTTLQREYLELIFINTPDQGVDSVQIMADVLLNSNEHFNVLSEKVYLR